MPNVSLKADNIIIFQEGFMNTVTELMLNHRSIRKYQKKMISVEIKEEIIRCAQMAPTSSYFQAYTIIEINDSKEKKALAEAAGGQDCVEKAPLVLLFCADLYRNKLALHVEDPEVFGNVESYTVAVVDTALSMQKAFIAAQSFGLGGVVIGGIRNDMNAIKSLTKLPPLVMPLFLLCLGYPDENPDVKPRLPIHMVWKKDFYDSSFSPAYLYSYNKEVSSYFDKLTDGEDQYNWIERCSHALKTKPRYEVSDFAHQAGLLIN